MIAYFITSAKPEKSGLWPDRPDFNEVKKVLLREASYELKIPLLVLEK